MDSGNRWRKAILRKGPPRPLRRTRAAAPILVAILVVLLVIAVVAQRDRIMCHVNYPHFLDRVLYRTKCEVPVNTAPIDRNSNGVYDAFDTVAGARSEVKGRTRYNSDYYSGGYPPDRLGACTDVVWRALSAAGYDLKSLIDADIKAGTSSYPRVTNRPDPNIDFRRVPNLEAFFKRHARMLTTDVVPRDVHNLIQWQPGDIVTFAHPMEHVGVVSDRRRADGVPLVIHNAGPWASESDILLRWPTGISCHFRFPG